MALLTVRAAAAQLGVAYSTLKRWVHTGRVRTTRTEGGHHRVSDAEIARLLARQPLQAKRSQASVAAGTGPAKVVTRSDESLEGLSARNRLHGFIDEVRVDGLLAQVRLRVGDQSLTAVITTDAVRALKLRRGQDAIAIIKSTEVMIARSVASKSTPGGRSRRQT
jgi:molybdopterin-binding protein